MAKAVGSGATMSRRVTRAVGAVLGGAAVVAAAVFVAPAAQAAESAGGFGDFYNGSGYFKGAMRQDGIVIYCGEKGLVAPTAPLISVGMQDATFINANFQSAWGHSPALTDDQVAGINRLQYEVGGSGDPVTEAAIEYAQHAVMYPGVWNDLNGNAHATMDEMIAADLVMPQVGGTPEDAAAVTAAAYAYLELINSTTAAVAVAGEGELVFTEGADQYTRTLTVDATPGATGTVTLTNAVFEDTGEATHAVTAGDVLTVRVSAPAGQAATVEVSGVADLTVGTAGYAAQLSAWVPAEGVNQQSALGMGPVIDATMFSIEGSVDAVLTVDTVVKTEVVVKTVALAHTGDDLVTAPMVWAGSGSVLAVFAAIAGVLLVRARRARSAADAANLRG